jgi:eight-cysteine-cluster-containing protein
MRILVALFAFVAACSGPSGTSGPSTAPVTAGGARTPALMPGSPNYDLFEGTSFQNDCSADGDCKIGGCGGEVCSAEEGAITPCIAHPDKPQASCGCVQGQCIWYTASK